MSDSPEPYLLASTILTPEELPKLALVTYDPSTTHNNDASGSQPPPPPPHTQRIFVIVSNVSFGVEQSCVLVIKPRRKDPSTAVLLEAIPILPDLKIEIEPQQGLTASAATPRNHPPAATTLGLSSLPQTGPTIHTLLESVVPDLFESKAVDSSNAALKLTLSHGSQAASGMTSDARGLKDFLSVLKDLLKVAQEHSFEKDKTHGWMKAYTEDLSHHSASHPGPSSQLETPIFSRFTNSAFLPSNAAAHIARPASPTASDIRISVGTFNVNSHLPPDDIPTMIGLKKWIKAEQDPDLIVLGFQEVDNSSGAYLYHSPAKEDAWVRAITRALGRRSEKYRKLASKQLVGLMVLVFARQGLEVDEVATASVGVGLGGFVANKGAVAVRMGVGERTICFVNSHLSAMEGLQAMERRCWDWSEVYKRLRFRLERDKVDFWESPEGGGKNRFKTRQDVKDEIMGADRGGERSSMERDDSSNPVGEEVSKPFTISATNPDDQPAPPPGITDQLTSATSLDITSDFIPASHPPPLSTTTSPPYVEQSITDHDVIIHFGDLNFRLDLSHSEAHRLIRQGDLATLYRYDQLESLRTSGSLFDDFHEGTTAAFAPTYKFDRGTDVYDTSEKMRVPAWADRVLWCVTREWEEDEVGKESMTREEGERERRQGVVLQEYGSVTDLKFSDHRAVRATFVVRVR